MRIFELCTYIKKTWPAPGQARLQRRREALEKLGVRYTEKVGYNADYDATYKMVTLVPNGDDVVKLGGYVEENGFEAALDIYWRRATASGKKPYRKHFQSCTFCDDVKHVLLLLPSPREEVWVRYSNPF